MSEDVYTVEQFAERLKLHRKTVLRFIREGRLRPLTDPRALDLHKRRDVDGRVRRDPRDMLHLLLSAREAQPEAAATA